MPNTVGDLAPSSSVPGLGLYLPTPSGAYIGTPHAIRSAAAVTLNRMYCSPIAIGESGTYDRIASEIVVAYAATGVVRLGIYTDTSGLPGTLSLDAGTIIATAIARTDITISKALTPGLYWLACVVQVTATTGTHRHATWPSVQMPATTPEGANCACYPYASSVSGALPGTFTLAGYSPTAPIVWIRHA